VNTSCAAKAKINTAQNPAKSSAVTHQRRPTLGTEAEDDSALRSLCAA
jgi:hypothetical protein